MSEYVRVSSFLFVSGKYILYVRTGAAHPPNGKTFGCCTRRATVLHCSLRERAKPTESATPLRAAAPPAGSARAVLVLPQGSTSGRAEHGVPRTISTDKELTNG